MRGACGRMHACVAHESCTCCCVFVPVAVCLYLLLCVYACCCVFVPVAVCLCLLLCVCTCCCVLLCVYACCCVPSCCTWRGVLQAPSNRPASLHPSLHKPCAGGLAEALSVLDDMRAANVRPTVVTHLMVVEVAMYEWDVRGGRTNPKHLEFAQEWLQQKVRVEHELRAWSTFFFRTWDDVLFFPMCIVPLAC